MLCHQIFMAIFAGRANKHGAAAFECFGSGFSNMSVGGQKLRADRPRGAFDSRVAILVAQNDEKGGA